MLKGIGSKSDAVNLMPELKQKLHYEFKVTVIVQAALNTWLRMGCKENHFSERVFKDAVFR